MERDTPLQGICISLENLIKIPLDKKGGWLAPRAGFDVLEKRKISKPCHESDHNSLAVCSVAYSYEFSYKLM